MWGLLSAIAGAALASVADLATRRLQSRKRAASALLELYRAITNCHEAYRYYVEECDDSRGSPSTWSRDLLIRPPQTSKALAARVTWLESVEKLVLVVDRHKEVLHIFDADVSGRLRSYIAGEMAHIDASSSPVLNEAGRQIQVGERLRSYLERADFPIMVMADFEGARDALASFMRQHTDFADYF